MKCLWNACTRNTTDTHMSESERLLIYVTGYCGEHLTLVQKCKEGKKIPADLKKFKLTRV